MTLLIRSNSDEKREFVSSLPRGLHASALSYTIDILSVYSISRADGVPLISGENINSRHVKLTTLLGDGLTVETRGRDPSTFHLRAKRESHLASCGALCTDELSIAENSDSAQIYF